jgi:hypothetical protein
MPQQPFTGWLLALFLASAFFLAAAWSTPKRPNDLARSSKRSSGLEMARKAAGAGAMVAGTALLLSWVYFLFTDRGVGFEGVTVPFITVILEMIASGLLLIGGWALAANRTRGPSLYFFATAFFIFTTIMAFLTYQGTDYPFLLLGVSIILSIAAAYFVGVVYAWEHFVTNSAEKTNAIQAREPYPSRGPAEGPLREIQEPKKIKKRKAA